MYAERESHIVRVIVEHHHVERRIAADARDEQMTDVVIIAAAHEHRAVFARHLRIERLPQLAPVRHAAAETDRFLP